MRHARGLGRLYCVLGDADYGGSMAHAGAAYRSELADIVRQPQRIGAKDQRQAYSRPPAALGHWQATMASKEDWRGRALLRRWRCSIASKCPPDQSMH